MSYFSASPPTLQPPTTPAPASRWRGTRPAPRASSGTVRASFYGGEEFSPTSAASNPSVVFWGREGLAYFAWKHERAKQRQGTPIRSDPIRSSLQKTCLRAWCIYGSSIVGCGSCPGRAWNITRSGRPLLTSLISTVVPLPPRIRFVSGTFVYRARFRRATVKICPTSRVALGCLVALSCVRHILLCVVLFLFASWPDKYAPALKIQISRMCPGTGCSAGPAAGAGALAAPVRPGLPNAFHGGKGHVRRPQAGAGLRNGSSDGVSWVQIASSGCLLHGERSWLTFFASHEV